MKRLIKIQTFAMVLLSSALISAQVQVINNIDDFNNLLASNKPAVIKVAAEWCHACQTVKEPFVQLSNNPEFSYITFAQADFDANRDWAQTKGVVGVPTFFFVAKGEIVERETGSKSNFNDFFSNLIRTKLSPNSVNTSADVQGKVETQATVLNPITGTETTTKEVTTEKTKNGESVATKKTTTTTQPVDMSGMSFMDKIKAFFVWMFAAVRDVFTNLLNWIKGLFGR